MRSIFGKIIYAITIRVFRLVGAIRLEPPGQLPQIIHAVTVTVGGEHKLTEFTSVSWLQQQRASSLPGACIWPPQRYRTGVAFAEGLYRDADQYFSRRDPM
tara:strand:+ start:491 stop:793 length:303 start_codon:yes stop_codon:yes gene_type:complete